MTGQASQGMRWMLRRSSVLFTFSDVSIRGVRSPASQSILDKVVLNVEVSS